MLRRLRKLFGFESRLAQRDRFRRRARPAVEFLEDRLAPASFTYTVPAGDVSNAGSGTTGGLVWAINQANSDHHTGTDIINLTPGILAPYGFTAPANPGAADGPSALPTITSAVAINGNSSLLFRSTAATTPAFRLFDVSSRGSLVLNNMMLFGGLAQGSGVSAQGGAVYSQGTLALTNVTLQSNAAIGSNGTAHGPGAEADGGALYVASGMATLTNDTIAANTAQGGNGDNGGNIGGVLGFDGGAGGPGAGGGIYVAGGTVLLTNDTIASNTARGGKGGVGGTGAGSAGSWVGGFAGSGGVGGIGGPGLGSGICVGGGRLVLTNDTIASNTAQGGQGGQGGQATGGTGGDGGTGGQATGGGLYVSNGTLSLTNDTVALNIAHGGTGGDGGSGTTGQNGAAAAAGLGNGGGLYVSGGSVSTPFGTVDMANTLIAENAGPGGGPNVWGGLASSNHDLVGDGWDNTLINGVNGDQVGSIFHPINPLLGPLQSNGGPTQTLALLSGSPALDAGDDTAVLAAIDQRGYDRITGNHIDIGAYESGAVAATADLSVSVQAPATVTPGSRLTYTLTVANIGATDQGDVTLIDPLPDNTSLVSWSVPSGWSSDALSAGNSGSVSAWIASLPKGASATFTLTVYVSLEAANGDLLGNTASVGPLTGDPNAANNSASALTSVVSQPPTRLEFLQTPTGGVAGQALSPLQVVLEDARGDTVSGDNTDTVALSVAGGFAKGSTLTATVVNGVATFGNVVLNTTGTYTLAAAAPGLAGATAPAFTITPGAISKLAFKRLPTLGTAGQALGGVQVAVEDQFGNVVTSANVGQIGVTVASGPGGFARGSTTTAFITRGVATFSNLVLDTAGRYTLKAAPGGGRLTAVTSAAFTVNPAAASQLVFTKEPAAGTAGKALTAVLASLEDAYGNVETGNNVAQVTLAVAGGPGAFAGGSTTTATVSHGVATFSHLLLDTAGTYSLAASTTVTTPLVPRPQVTLTLSATSVAFAVSPAAVSKLAFTQLPPPATAGQVLGKVQVALEDKYGNIETGLTGLIGLSIAKGPAGAGSAGGSTTTASVVHGVATFSNLVLDTAGSYALTAKSLITSLPTATSAGFTVSPAAASKLAFIHMPSGGITGSTLGAVQVAIEDQFGNVESKDNRDKVTLSVAGGPGGFASGSTLTATVNKGVAVFSNLVLSPLGSYQLKAVAGALTAAKSPAISIAKDVSAAVTVSGGSITKIGTGLYQQVLTITNTSGGALIGPLALAFSGLSGADVSNATGTFLGNQYLDFLAAGQQLKAGQALVVMVKFLDFAGPPSPGYTTQVLEGI